MDEDHMELQMQRDEMTSRHGDIAVKHKTKQKIKSTIYLTEEAELAFTELYIHRLRKDRKTDKSQIACDAIQALFEKECSPK